MENPEYNDKDGYYLHIPGLNLIITASSLTEANTTAENFSKNGYYDVAITENQLPVEFEFPDSKKENE